jgi:geranylgeranylglycerol-phosphate geranylgeranyltransferase
VHSPNWLLVAISGVPLMMAFQKGLHNFTLMGLGFIAIALVASGGFAINDFFDHHSDAIIKPSRPIPSNRISRTRAAQVSLLLFLAGLGVALAINLLVLGIAAFTTVFLVLYSAFFKRFTALSSVVIGLLSGTTIPIFCEATVLHTISIVALSFIGISLWGAGRNVLDDVIGAEGDMKVGYRTLAIKRGPVASSKLGALFCLLAVILLSFPYVVGMVSVAYLIPLVLMGCITSYLALSVFKKPDAETVKRLHKKFELTSVLIPIAIVTGTFFLR